MNELAAKLRLLAGQKSKHSQYQTLHPSLLQKLGLDLADSDGKLERARWEYLSSRCDFSGKSVMDIGANTGYFTFAALSAGAETVVSYEGNPTHAEFVSNAGEFLGWQDKLTVHSSYFTFDAEEHDPLDICICLNVVHHVGDDFGNNKLDIQTAREEMASSIRQLVSSCGTCIFQMGYNWKGDRSLPLFSRGEKEEVVAFVTEAVDGICREIDVAAVADGAAVYTPYSTTNSGRYDHMGEFMNRPLFILSQ